jgi:predicted Zn-dependent protease
MIVRRACTAALAAVVALSGAAFALDLDELRKAVEPALKDLDKPKNGGQQQQPAPERPSPGKADTPPAAGTRPQKPTATRPAPSIPMLGEVPLEDEVKIGREVAGNLLGASPLVKDSALQRYVNQVGRWVASQSTRPDLKWTFGVIESSDINAFAAPGGYILVTRGLYELLSSDSELAAVLGHEISHCVQRDHYNVIRKQELTAMGKDAVSAQVHTGVSPAETFARQYVESHGATILLTSLDRDAEFRSDKAAEIYLARSGMNPMALYSVLQKMLALGAQSASLAALYKTHPPLDARLDRIDERGYGALKAYTARE